MVKKRSILYIVAYLLIKINAPIAFLSADRNLFIQYKAGHLRGMSGLCCLLRDDVIAQLLTVSFAALEAAVTPFAALTTHLYC